jgi:hypothetical protein
MVLGVRMHRDFLPGLQSNVENPKLSFSSRSRHLRTPPGFAATWLESLSCNLRFARCAFTTATFASLGSAASSPSFDRARDLLLPRARACDRQFGREPKDDGVHPRRHSAVEVLVTRQANPGDEGLRVTDRRRILTRRLPPNQRNWMLFSIASYVGCKVPKSACGAMKTM